MNATATANETRGRRLLALGATLFMLGLLTGFVVQMLTNPRMGLSGHLEGVMMLAGLWGTSEISPIAGAGFTGVPWQESVVTLGLSSVGVAMVAGAALLMLGFFRRA